MDWARFIPSIMNSIIALRCLGYSLDDPQVIRAMDEFEKLGIEEEDTFRMQPCVSPVWDTAYADVCARREAGVPAQRSAHGEVRRLDPAETGAHGRRLEGEEQEGQPGGWYFEFNNEFYPDVDDSAMVCLALSRVEHPNGRYQRESVQRAIDWIFSMQCKNGGLGVVRQRQRSHGLPVRAIRRPQCHARSRHRGYHRPHPGDAGDLWIFAKIIRR